jgi:hypothetical protein
MVVFGGVLVSMCITWGYTALPPPQKSLHTHLNLYITKFCNIIVYILNLVLEYELARSVRAANRLKGVLEYPIKRV